MGLDKAIQHGKQKRKPYRRSKEFDRSCRPGGSCKYCQNDRTYHTRKIREGADIDLRDEWTDPWPDNAM